MSLIFFGSSEFSIHALKACLESGRKISLVVTTPPQKKGRGLQESATPVQLFAESHKLPFMAPVTLKNPDLLQQAEALKPEYFVVSSYGKIIPTAWLKLPSRYAINVHPSLLPKYRGAAPINWPIILGDKETGVSLAEVTPELDAGDLFYQKSYPIPADTDSDQMTELLGKYSYEAVKEIFETLKKGDLTRKAQDHKLFNYARKLSKDDGRLNWGRTAEEIHNQVRGLLPWPIVSFNAGEPVQILKTSLSSESSGKQPGTVLAIQKDSLWVQTGKGVISLDRVKPAGRKEMSAGDFARGKRFNPGHLFESDAAAPSFTLTQSYK